MKNKLVLVTSENIINDLKIMGVKLLFPLKNFCVGVTKEFNLSEIVEDGYLFINRILDSKAMDDVKKIILNLPTNIKGIVFDDLGLIEVLKNTNIEKILYYSHFNCNYISINYFFDYVDEVILSTDICEEEIDFIIKNVKKEISLVCFALLPAMYSRRYLLTNHALNYNLENTNVKLIDNTNQKFIAFENSFGTYICHYPYFDGLKLLKKKAKYYLFLPVNLPDEKVLNVLENNLSGIETDDGFLNKKTIYKVK